MAMFRRISIPNDITLKFLQIAQQNTGFRDNSVFCLYLFIYLFIYLFFRVQIEKLKLVVFSQAARFTINF